MTPDTPRKDRTESLSLALSTGLAAFGAWAWLTHFGLLPQSFAVPAGGLLMAALCLTAQFLANAHAANGRYFSTRGARRLVRLCIAKVVFFAAVSAFGVHHGYEIVKAVAPSLGVSPLPDLIALPLLMCLALFEPLNFLVVEARREWETRQPANAEETVAPATGTRGAARRKGLSLVAGAAAFAAMTQGEQVTAPLDGSVAAPEALTGVSASGRAEIRARAVSLRKGGVSITTIAQLTGVPRSTVGKWVKPQAAHL